MSKVKQAHAEVAEGLLTVLEQRNPTGPYLKDTTPEHIRWMLLTIQDKCQEWPVDKTARWLGFAQGAMTANGWLDVAEERDRTRPIFHAAYEAEGLDKPESVG